MGELHDREWIWWSGAIVDNLLKIDLSVESLPISTWPIESVIERAGATILYRGDWKPSSEISRRP